MYGYVYLTTNLINNKKYIGMHKAAHFDTNYKGSGILISEAFEKYGWDNFTCEVLKWCDTQLELRDSEKYFIEMYNALEDPNYYNIAAGGAGGDIFNHLPPEKQLNWREHTSQALMGKPKSEVHRKKIQLAAFKNDRSGENNPMWGKHRLAPNSGKKAYNNGLITKYLTEEESMQAMYSDFKPGGLPRYPKGTYQDRLKSQKEAKIKQLESELNI